MSKHVFEFIPQYKGKDITKVNDKHLMSEYLVGTKYDGHYVQIHKFGNEVVFFTSGGKSFKLDDIEDELVYLNPAMNFIIETEHIGLTDGKAGSRGQCTTTTWFTNFAKGISSFAKGKQFKVFDLLYLEYNKQDFALYDCLVDEDTFVERGVHSSLLKLGSCISKIDFVVMPLFEIDSRLDIALSDGWEGLFAFNADHKYKKTNTARSNLALKFKFLPTADLLCIDVKYSDINPEDIASLICQDSKGRVVAVGHLKHYLKRRDPSSFIGRVIEFKYESMGVNTYLQPRFSTFRNDKTKEEID